MSVKTFELLSFVYSFVYIFLHVFLLALFSFCINEYAFDSGRVGNKQATLTSINNFIDSLYNG